MAFDPDAFLSGQQSAAGFDPDAFLKEGEPQERGVLERAGEAMTGTFQSGLEAGTKLFTPRTKEEAEEGYGVTGALKGLKETGLGLLSPLTMAVGAPMAGAQSLIASGMSALQRGAQRGITAGVEQFSPEKAEELRQRIPTSEQAYTTWEPNVGTAMQALGARPGFSALSTGEDIPRRLSRAFASDADTPAALNQRLAEARKVRPDATVADVAGRNTRDIVESLAQTPGVGRATVVPQLEARQKAQLQRLSDDLTGTTGVDKQTAFREVQGALGAREIESAPLYKRAFAEGDFAIWEQSPELQRLVSAPDIQTAMRKAITSWRNEAVRDGYGSMNPPYVPKQGREAGNISFQGVTQIPVQPNLQFWDYTKRALDKMIDQRTTSQGKKPSTLVDLTAQFRGALDALGIDSYAQARAAWAGRSKYIEAIEDGRSIFNRTMPSEEFAANFNALSAGEKEGQRIGVVGAILQKMRSNPAKLPDLTRELRSPDMREKLTAIMPTPEAAERFNRVLDFEVKSSELVHQALPNSATYRRLMQKADADNIFGEMTFQLLTPHKSTHGWLKLLAKVYKPVRDRLMAQLDARSAELLLGKGDLPIRSAPMIRRPLIAPIAGPHTVDNNEGFKKGGRVTKPLRVRRYAAGGPAGPGGGGGDTQEVTMVNDPASPSIPVSVGLPPGFAGMAGNMTTAPGIGGAGGTQFDSAMSAAYANPQEWGMTREDLSSPLDYTQADWQPRDAGGYFTMGQLFDFAPSGARAAKPEISTIQGPAGPGSRAGGLGIMNRPAGQNVPEIFQADSDLPSTNNWRLLPPPYNKPQYVMRSGHIIDTFSPGRRAHSWGQSTGPWLPGTYATSGMGQGEYPIQGTVIPEFGSPGAFRAGISFWPGQLESERRHAWPLSAVARGGRIPVTRR